MDRGCIDQLLNTSSNTSLGQWIKLLNFAENHKNELSLIEMRLLADASERHRLYWNKTVTHTIIQNGKKLTKTRTGLGITQIDVNPSIHRMLEQKEQNTTHNKNYNTESLSNNVVIA